MVCAWSWYARGLINAENVIARFLRANLGVVLLMIAHIIERLFILARARVFVYIFAVLGAHVRRAFDVREAGGVFLIVSRARYLLFHLGFPDLLPLSFGDALSSSCLLGLTLANFILSRARIGITDGLVLTAHVRRTLHGFAESISII